MTKNIYIGRGIYSVAEAARLTKVHSNTIRNWMFVSDRKMLKPDFRPINDQKALSFYDLIEVLITGQLRGIGLSLPHIRKVHNYLKEKLETEHPFCHQKLKSDGKKSIIIEALNADEEMLYQEVLSGQHLSPEVIEPYVKKIDYDNVTHLAKRWNVHEGIVVDPAVVFGSPVIKNTRLSSSIITAEYNANNKNEELIADLYQVTEQDVLNAVAFEKQLHDRVAA